ncbi:MULTISPECIES: MoaD/ThiS family protein [unclassified Agromyces]|uniref:MoaD/ThiS family protein n=1 Tax=unclassified Agromyces TaxID=2639701 RepID=UPI003015069E
MADGTTTTSATETATRAGTVLVRYFAAAAEAAGVEEERLGPTPTLGELRDVLVSRYGAPMARVVANGSFLVDGVVRRDPATPIGAQVDVLPPFAGG